MKPVYQKNESTVDGDCFVACLASIFEDDIDSYPELPMEPGWLKIINEHLIEKHDLYIVQVGHDEHTHKLVHGYHLIMVDMVGESYGHCLVGKDTKIVHNPSRGYGSFENYEYGLFVKYFSDNN